MYYIIAFEKLAPKIHIVHTVVAVFRYTLWMAYLVHTNNFRRNVKLKIDIANEMDRIVFILSIQLNSQNVSIVKCRVAEMGLYVYI